MLPRHPDPWDLNWHIMGFFTATGATVTALMVLAGKLFKYLRQRREISEFNWWMELASQDAENFDEIFRQPRGG